MTNHQGTSAHTTLVTGATGFIGANLVLHLAQHGHRVIAFDVSLPIPLLEEYWRPVRPQISFELGSVTDSQRLTEIASQYKLDAILHAAAVTAITPSSEAQMAARMVEVNLMGTVRLLDLAQQIQARRFVYVSSSGVYGRTKLGQSLAEIAPIPTAGLDLYHISKETSERLCHRFAELFGTSIAIGRLNGPYGPMERDTGVRPIMSPIYQLATAALLKGTVRIAADDPIFDWTYTIDLAEAIRRLLEAETLPNEVYNLSNGQGRSLSDVIALLAELMPGAHFERVGRAESADVDLRGVPHRGPLDITRLRQDVGFEPAYDLEHGLAAALPWWRAQLQQTGRSQA